MRVIRTLDSKRAARVFRGAPQIAIKRANRKFETGRVMFQCVCLCESVSAKGLAARSGTPRATGAAGVGPKRSRRQLTVRQEGSMSTPSSGSLAGKWAVARILEKRCRREASSKRSCTRDPPPTAPLIGSHEQRFCLRLSEFRRPNAADGVRAAAVLSEILARVEDVRALWTLATAVEGACGRGLTATARPLLARVATGESWAAVMAITGSSILGAAGHRLSMSAERSTEARRASGCADCDPFIASTFPSANADEAHRSTCTECRTRRTRSACPGWKECVKKRALEFSIWATVCAMRVRADGLAACFAIRIIDCRRRFRGS